MKRLLPALSFCCVLSAAAESRPANETELQAVRAALSLDSIPATRHHVVMDVEGPYSGGETRGSGRLQGVAWFRPYMIQDALCLAETLYVYGTESGQGFAWEKARPVHRYWAADAPGS